MSISQWSSGKKRSSIKNFKMLQKKKRKRQQQQKSSLLITSLFDLEKNRSLKR